jgi:hypothetical protein
LADRKIQLNKYRSKDWNPDRQGQTFRKKGAQSHGSKFPREYDRQAAETGLFVFTFGLTKRLEEVEGKKSIYPGPEMIFI